MYITGGIGPSAHNEGFTTDYDLPNLSAYQETCASVALAQWNHRLTLLYGDAKYADVMERSLYNGVLAGVSLDGTKFFYVNPLESRGNHHRSPWFGCACCPPNVARTLASLGGYAYAVGPDSLTVNLYVQGSATTQVNGAKVVLHVETDYPWDGKVTIRPKVEKPTRFALRLRNPGWCEGATIAINGQSTSPKVERGYFVLDMEWKTGDEVTLNLPMPVERIAANPNVKADAGQVAFQRGPIVYCLEQADNPDVPLSDLFIPATGEFTSEKKPDLLGGVVVLKGKAAVSTDPDWSGTLYQAMQTPTWKSVTAIPYFAWDNREPGAMKVWLPTAPRPVLPGGPETRAKVTMSFVNNNCQPQGINDGKEIKSSGEQPEALAHWWPHKGGTEWAQYTWPRAVALSAARVYWFDDTGRGACRLPVSWRLEYQDGDSEAWVPVKTDATYNVVKDRFCRVTFEPIQTKAMRLVVSMQPEWAAGVHEWVVEETDGE
jgi:hypothetical protein